jgi:hypothetical protein
VRGYVRRSDADALTAVHEAALAALEDELRERIAARVAAGDDYRTAAAAEVHLSLAQVDALSARFEEMLLALPTFSADGEPE